MFGNLGTIYRSTFLYFPPALTKVLWVFRRHDKTKIEVNSKWPSFLYKHASLPDVSPDLLSNDFALIGCKYKRV